MVKYNNVCLSTYLQSNFIEITLRHGYHHVNLLHIFRTPFRKNASKGASRRKFVLGGYVNLGPFILDNIRTLVKALQKQSS